MKSTEIIEAIRQKLTVPSGRHLYGVLGTYTQLDAFAKKLHQAKTTEGKRPEPTAAHVARAFERFLRANLTGLPAPGAARQAGKGILVLSNLEMLFAYRIELNLLRTMAADEDRVLLLLPGRRSRGRIIITFHETDKDTTLPTNPMAGNQLRRIRE